MRFRYTRLALAVFVDGDDRRHPIPGNWIYGVTIGEGEHRRVLGLVQMNPSIENEWRAVAAADPSHFPAVDPERGVWPLTPGRSGFRTRKEASVWLLGASDARSAWWFAGSLPTEGS